MLSLLKNGKFALCIHTSATVNPTVAILVLARGLDTTLRAVEKLGSSYVSDPLHTNTQPNVTPLQWYCYWQGTRAGAPLDANLDPAPRAGSFVNTWWPTSAMSPAILFAFFYASAFC